MLQYKISRNVKVGNFLGKNKFKRHTEYKTIYTKEEADLLDLYYIYWRDVEIVQDVESGDLVLTDDDFVIEVLKIKRNKYGKNVILRTPHQTVYIDVKGKNKLTIEPTEARTHLHHVYRPKHTKNITKKQYEFCKFVAMGHSPYNAYKITFNSTSKVFIEVNSTKLILRENILEIIMNIGKEFEDRGFNFDDFITNMTNLAKNARNENTKFLVNMKIAEMCDWIGINKKVNVPITGIDEIANKKRNQLSADGTNG